VLDVSEGEGDDLGAAHGGGVSEEDDRGVADADRCAVDGADDLADLVHGERLCQTSWCGAVGAQEAAAYLTDDFGGDGVLDPAHPVDVPDVGAGHVESAVRLARLGTLGQVGTQRQRVARQGRDPAGVAPALPLAPGLGVDGAGGLRPCGTNGRGDARGVQVGEPGQ